MSKLIDNNYKFYTKKQYYSDLLNRINRLGSSDHIELMTMSFEPDVPEIGKVVEALCNASKRGAKVIFCIDAYSFLKANFLPGPLFYSRTLTSMSLPVFQRKYNVIKKLKKHGVKCQIVNPPKRFFSRPFAGRCHIKTVIINDYFYIGGCNLNDPTQTDLMIGFNHKPTADFLRDFVTKTFRNNQTTKIMNGQDVAHIIDDQTSIFIDSGIPDQSIIFDQARKLIDEANESIFITYQYFPNGVIARQLKKAYKRGVKITIAYNLPIKHGFIKSLGLYPVYFYERLRLPSRMFGHSIKVNEPFLHAKAIISEKAAMTGSHNFVPAGVKFGTTEIALLTTDTKLKKTILNGISTQL